MFTPLNSVRFFDKSYHEGRGGGAWGLRMVFAGTSLTIFRLELPILENWRLTAYADPETETKIYITDKHKMFSQCNRHVLSEKGYLAPRRRIKEFLPNINITCFLPYYKLLLKF